MELSHFPTNCPPTSHGFSDDYCEWEEEEKKSHSYKEFSFLSRFFFFFIFCLIIHRNLLSLPIHWRQLEVPVILSGGLKIIRRKAKFKQ